MVGGDEISTEIGHLLRGNSVYWTHFFESGLDYGQIMLLKLFILLLITVLLSLLVFIYKKIAEHLAYENTNHLVSVGSLKQQIGGVV